MNQTYREMNLFHTIILPGLMIAPITTLLLQTMQHLGTSETHRPNIVSLRHHPLTRTPTIPRLSRRRVALTSSSSLSPVLSHPRLRVDASSTFSHQPPRFNYNVVTINFACTQNSATEGYQRPASILDQPPYSITGLWMKH